MLRAHVRSILMPATSHIACLNCHTLKFPRVGLKLTLCQPFAVQGLLKSGNPDSCTPKKVILKCFFCKESIFLAKGPTFAYSMSHIFWKLLVWRLIIGPESDHWLCLSLTHWLTDSLTDCRLVNLIDVTLAWKCLLKTCWGCYCWWCWCWGSCWQQFVTDLGADVWS